MANYVAEQYASWNAEYALLGIQLPLKLVKCLEGLRIYHYVISICLNELIPDLVFEALLDGSLIGCTSIFQPKQHGHVAVSTEGRDERCLDLVLLS
jgi:hypothetical protein